MYNWENYFAFSKYMSSTKDYYKNDEETKYRVILSRCYYAAFHLAKEFVAKHKLESLYASGEHDRIIFYLKNPAKGTADFKRSCIRLSTILSRLKKNRVLADYERDAVITELDVMDQINKTNELIQEVKRLS